MGLYRGARRARSRWLFQLRAMVGTAISKNDLPKQDLCETFRYENAESESESAYSIDSEPDCWRSVGSGHVAGHTPPATPRWIDDNGKWHFSPRDDGREASRRAGSPFASSSSASSSASGHRDRSEPSSGPRDHSEPKVIQCVVVEELWVHVRQTTVTFQEPTIIEETEDQPEIQPGAGIMFF